MTDVHGRDDGRHELLSVTQAA
ncbi:MAG: hypothetical protein RLZZ199_694, partial [Actinomycetota bacterium]